MLAIQPMTPLDARRDWGWIRNGLLEVIGRCQERWMPEDVWTAVQAGNAFLWRVVVNHDDIGFLVLRRDQELDGPVLYIWALWTEPQALVEWQRDLITRLDELAARVGAKRIRMESRRRGWAGLDYFEPGNTIYEREVSHGQGR